jgi:hypothetical protein
MHSLLQIIHAEFENSLFWLYKIQYIYLFAFLFEVESFSFFQVKFC